MKQAIGLRSNNPLNLRITSTSWKGKITPSNSHGFEVFDSMHNGIRAAVLNMFTHIKRDRAIGLATTVASEITRWAPPSENVTVNYIEFVCAKAKVNPTLILRVESRNFVSRVLWAMAWLECGKQLPYDDFLSAYDDAIKSVS